MIPLANASRAAGCRRRAGAAWTVRVADEALAGRAGRQVSRSASTQARSALMTLYPQAAQDIGPVPTETARVERGAFPHGNVYLRLRDEVGVLYADETFAPLFSTRGRPAEAPWRLALVSVLQYVEGLTDRQAAEAVRGRIDWKYALGLDLADPGFDASVLAEFRERLVAGQAETLLLEGLLERCKQRVWLKAGGKQRTASTHVLARLRSLSNLECVGETLRAALEDLAALAPEWLG